MDAGIQIRAVFGYIFLLIVSSSYGLNSDGLSLLALKSAITTDPSRMLDSWLEFDSTPCRWLGVTCTRLGRVSKLALSNKGFTGYIPSELGLLNSIEELILSHNNFSKLVPIHLFNATSLQSLDLSYNSLSGPVSNQIVGLKYLTRLDLSSNRFNGSLPEGLSELSNLSGTLNLSYNQFIGEVPVSFGNLPVMVSLDLRNNNLTGKIPQVGSLLNQGPTAFTGNPGLCGFPLQTPCTEAQDPKIITPPENPKTPIGPVPEVAEGGTEKVKNQRVSVMLAITIISGVSLVLGAVSVILWQFLKKRSSDEGKIGNKKELNVPLGIDEIEEKAKFVVIDEGLNLELEDLLRASAFVVGKSKAGIVYRVVVAGAGSRAQGSGVAGTAVAVRRLSENDATWRFKEFEAEVEAIGRVQHPNIVQLKAYYYANDEKLLVSDYINNGSLYTALHGGPSSTLPPLSWATRLQIAQGIAHGLVHIHEHSPRKYVHGAVKSSKILLDNNLQPYISGFGLTRLFSANPKSLSPTLKKQNSNQTVSIIDPKISPTSVSYIAPEARVLGTKLTQKCDVYSFGIVLMEILTGKLPEPSPENDNKGLESLVRKVFKEERPLSEIIDPAILHEVHAKKQVVVAFHIALNCTEIDPELRPRMRMICESLDGIKSQ